LSEAQHIVSRTCEASRFGRPKIFPISDIDEESPRNAILQS
jgi:hypothetical protein